MNPFKNLAVQARGGGLIPFRTSHNSFLYSNPHSCRDVTRPSRRIINETPNEFIEGRSSFWTVNCFVRNITLSERDIAELRDVIHKPVNWWRIIEFSDFSRIPSEALPVKRNTHH